MTRYGSLSKRELRKMIKVAKFQRSRGSALSFFGFWTLAAAFVPSLSETKPWPGTPVPGLGPLGPALRWRGSSSVLSLQETQVHLLIRNQDNAGHTLHLPCLRGRGHLVLLDQLGDKMHTGLLKSVISSHCPPLHAPTLCLPKASLPAP